MTTTFGLELAGIILIPASFIWGLVMAIFWLWERRRG